MLISRQSLIPSRQFRVIDCTITYPSRYQVRLEQSGHRHRNLQNTENNF